MKSSHILNKVHPKRFRASSLEYADMRRLFFMEEKQQVIKGHKLNLNARKNINITGVNDVLSFDAGEVLLQTEQGILMIRGAELHVNRLTIEKGEVDIDGRIDSLTYSDTANYGKSGESLLGRLFK